MSMEDITTAKKLRGLRMRLSPVLNNEAVQLLKDAERELNGAATAPGKPYQKPGKVRKPSKAELKARFSEKRKTQ